MKILVIGSLNTDLTICVPRFARPGETIIGDANFVTSQGGKGANQAVAAASAGEPVAMFGKVGDDRFGEQAIESLIAANVNCDFMLRSDSDTTGLAAILVDPEGENSITVAPGANAALSPRDITTIKTLIGDAQMVMMQMEIPHETVEQVADLALQSGTPVMLDPAPAPPTLPDYLSGISYLTPNSGEAEALTGISVDNMDAAHRVADRLLATGLKHVVLTLGERGALVAGQDLRKHISPFPADAVDTTGAGDTFNGFLATSLIKGFALPKAAEIAAAAAALAVTRPGARTNLPSWDETMAFMATRRNP